MALEIDAPVLSNDRVGPHCWELSVQAPDLADAALPGQFVHVAYGGQCSSWMRRPFSIYRTRPDEGAASLLYLCRGEFTRGLSQVRPGEQISIVGPLGNSFGSFVNPGSSHVLVAGGIGAPPIAFLAEHLAATGQAGRTFIVNGARTSDLLVARAAFAASGAAYVETTDDGSVGSRGLVTDVLANLLATESGSRTTYACGPTPMLKAVASVCEAHGTPCFVSLETVMPCGVGVCMGCVVKLRDASMPEGYTYVRSCHEGPVFAASDLIWD